MNKNIKIQLITPLILIFFSNILSLADDKISNLFSFFKKHYGNPYSYAGKVTELYGKNLLFSKGSNEIEEGQLLWVCENKEGISEKLQKKIADIQVKKIFQDTVYAEIISKPLKNIAAGYIVITKTAPFLYLYSNIKDKHFNPVYQKILKYIINNNYQLQEIKEDQIIIKENTESLLLRIEEDKGFIICRLTSIDGDQTFFFENWQHNSKVETIFELDHSLQHVNNILKTQFNVDKEKKINLKNDEKNNQISQKRYFKLDEKAYRIVSCDIDSDGILEFAFLSADSFSIYSLKNNVLKKNLKYNFSNKNYLPLHLHTIDLDKNGINEFLITISKKILVLEKLDSVLCSQILSIKNNKIYKFAKSIPYYLRVITDRNGNKIALAQKKGDFSQYEGRIYELKWDKTKNILNIDKNYEFANNVYSLYQFNHVHNNKNNIIILENGNDIHGYQLSNQSIKAYGVRNYGQYKISQYPIKLEQDQYVIGFEKNSFQLFSSPRRFELNPKFDWQSFIVYKERNLSSYAGIFNNKRQSNNKKDQLVGVIWADDRIVEKWASPFIQKEILDYTFINSNNIAILYRDSKEYAIEIFDVISSK